MASKKVFRVIATMLVAKVPGAQGGETYLRRGRLLPDSVPTEEAKRLLELGLVEKVEITDPAPPGDGGSAGGSAGGSGDGGAPTKPAGNAGYDKHAAWAVSLGIEIPAEVAAAKDRDAVKALIEAHEKSQTGPQGQ